MELISIEIKIISVDHREQLDKSWYRIEGMDLKSNERLFFSYWHDTPIPIKDKNYAIRYSVKGKYNNITNLVEIKLTKDGYIEVKVPDKIDAERMVEETPNPTQKTYSELGREDQIISTLNLIMTKIDDIKNEIDSISKVIYTKEDRI